MPVECNQTDLENIAKGACFLASGGGGTYESGRNLSNHFNNKSDYYHKPTFQMVSLDEIDDDGYAVVVAYIGAPEAIKTASYPLGAVRAVQEVQKYLDADGKQLKYVVPVEIGALSSVVPCLVASRLELAVIDGDGAGRAVPELTMLSFSAEGVSCNPTILTNSDDFSVTLAIGDDPSKAEPISDAAVVENITRPMLALPQFNEIAGLAIWIMDPKQIKTAIKSKNSLSLAQKTGAAIASESLKDVIQFLQNQGKKVFHLFDGQFDKDGSTSLTAGGFDHGTVTITDGDKKFIILYQNESLLAWTNGGSHPVAIAPDSIAMFVHDEQKVYSIGDVMDANGNLNVKLDKQSVSVVGIAAEAFLREEGKHGLLPVFMDAVRTLGYYGAYEPIEKLQG